MHRDTTSAGVARRSRRLRFGLGASAVVALVAAGLSPAASGTPPASHAQDEPEQRRVIVVMDGEPALGAAGADAMADGPGGLTHAAARDLAAEVSAHRAELRAAHRELLAAAADAGVRARTRHEFTDLVDAVAMTVAEADVRRLEALPGVADVVPDGRVRSATDVSVPLVGAPEVWQRADADGTPARGAGTTVAVLDSGIDYTNPSLGGAFGPGNKVVAGHDYVNGDADPMDDNGHGTHVAGIIAGDGDVTGVAPDARLTAYKVLDAGGGGYESDVIAGLEDAVDPANPHRADVVNLSLGSPGDGTDPIGLAATAATEAGVVVVAAAGNAGPGAHTVTSPAIADGVVAVGASASGLSVPSARMVEPREEPIQAFRAPYSASPPEQTLTGELVDVGDGTAEDYDRVGDVTGKVVAYRARVPRGMANVSPALIDQARLAEERGAIALLAYSGGSSGPVVAGAGSREPVLSDGTEPGTVDVPLRGAESGDSFRMDRIVVMGLRATQWSRLSRDLADGTVRIAVSGEDVTDRIAGFSSRGPTDEYELKPDLVAPGVEIRSTWPLAQWEPGVYRLSGTSMAGPHVAGAAALVRQLHPEATVADVGSRLVGSAKAVEGVGPATAGAGRLDVAAAASADVVADPASVSMGLADLSGPRVRGSGTVVLRNHGDEPADVALDTRAAPGSAGTATVEPATVRIPAGGQAEVRVSVSAATPTREADLSGWVVGRVGDDGTRLRVPYLLAARPLVVRTSPDPSDGASEAFVWSPVPLAEPPTLTVTPPKGRGYEVTAEHDHGDWYRAELTGRHAGAYTVDAAATTADGLGLRGSGSFEVADPPGPSNSPVRWQPIGPNGASGRIATTPADPDAAAVTQYLEAGPWTTDDRGATWTQHTRLPVAGGTGEIVVDADDPGTMWYAVNGSTGGFFDVLLDPTYTGRVLRTHDGGDTWKTLDLPDVHVIELLSDPDTEVLIAVTAESLLVSRDGGDTWSSYPNAAGSELAGAAVGGDDVFLAHRDGVLAVRGLVSGEPTATEQVYDAGDGSVDGLVADARLVAVLTGDDTVVGTRDGGATWRQLYDVPGGGAMDIVMSGADVVVTTYREHQHVGRDHARSWSTVPEPVTGAVENDVTAWGDGLLWSSPGAGLFRTGTDGSDPRRIGVQGTTPYDLEVVERDGTPTLLAGTDSDVYDTELPSRPKLEPDVAEWGLSGAESHTGTRVGQLAVSQHDPSTVWKVRKDALSHFWVYRSTDGGQTWDVRGRTTEVPHDIAVAPADPDRVVVPFWSLLGAGLYVTRDGGATWRKLYHPQGFTAVAAEPTEPGRLWLGSESGLYRSDDFGHTVHKVADGQVTAVEVSGSRVVAAGARIRVSTDGGETFETADSGSLPMRVTDLEVSPRDRDVWYAATGSYAANGLVKGGRGVLRSTDGGRSWVNVSGGLQNLDVVSLQAGPDGRWLFAGTVNGGVHRVRIR
ncbi:subtilase family protein [Haloactinopolyspora alba]|uniref:Subtilase family protein n=1 Tax=Haloactinopolyspora alba TaxID=648780 RepID=A0A2P8E8S6_9ACTN|nr:S8 family serine peptidase [Haloactinopolyspora alba]PSL05864.1 subtilase family protein [Haloactinopolyspora alba]